MGQDFTVWAKTQHLLNASSIDLGAAPVDGGCGADTTTEASGAHRTCRNAVPRPRGYVVVGGSPSHRGTHLLLPVRTRARHGVGPRLARGLRHSYRHLQEP